MNRSLYKFQTYYYLLKPVQFTLNVIILHKLSGYTKSSQYMLFFNQNRHEFFFLFGIFRQEGRLQIYTMTNRNVTLLFEPLSLEVKYQKVVKLQIAIFRLSAQQAKGNKRAVKMDKTDPVKYTNPQQKITFNKALSLLTTLPFNSETQTYDSKDVDLQIALEIDGKKERMGRKINLRDVLIAKNKNFKFVQESSMITFIYRAEVKVQEEKVIHEQQKKVEQVKKQQKILRFDEEVQNTKENVRQQRQLQNEHGRPERVQKGRYKTVFFEPAQIQTKIIDSHSEESQKLKKYRSLDRVNSEPQEKETKMDSRRSLDLQSKIQEFKEKYSKLQGLYAGLQKTNQQLEKKLKQKDAKLIEIIHKYEQLQHKLQNQLKSSKKQKQDLKRQIGKTHNENISQLKQQIRIYQNQIQKLRKTAVNFQQSTKHIASGSQQQIKTLKQKLYNLQRQNIQSTKQNQILQQSLKNKDDIISDLKAKIYSLDKQNLEYQNKVKSIQIKLNKNKQEYEQQYEQLQNTIKQMKEDNKNFKIATLKDIKDENTVDYKKKYETLEKQYNQKEQSFQKLSQRKKQNDAQISNLKKEISSLKQTIQKLESSKAQHHESQSSDIEIKIQLQKLKKELDTCRKNEKALLIEKGKLQASNRTLQDDIVKNKCAIANILNAVQQTGNQKLITEVYNLTQ